MKNKLLLLSLGLSMITQMIYSQVPSYVPTNGLAGYWGFNGNANDQSGNSNNGTVNGATLTTDRFGNANSAYSFDGISNFISVPNSSSLNITGNQISISVWLRTDDNCSTAYGQKGISKGGWDVGNGYELLYGSCGGFQLSGNRGGIQSVGSYNNGNWNGNWTHIVAVFNNGSGIIYANGQVINSGLNGNQFTNFVSSTAPLYFGKRSPGNQTIGFVKGKMDDIGIWNRALTSTEITTMYNGVSYSDTCNAVSGSLVNGLVGYWPFCGNANDQSGNGNNGTVNGASLTTDRFGNSNGAYNFIQGNTINIPNSLSLDNVKLASVNLWFKTNTTANSQLFKKGNSLTTSSGEQISIQLNYFNNNVVSAKYNSNCVPGNGWVNSSNNTISLNNNVWHMLSAVIDSNRLKYYIDGVLVSSTLAPNGYMDVCNGGGISLGKNWNDDPDFYNGIMDDIGFWNRALTEQEITQLYNQNQCMTNISVTDTLIINVGQLSYSNPITYANNITIYPNPASTQVNIGFNNITNLIGGNINIINSLGQKVATTPITLSGTNTTMSLNTWGGAGLYFVQILNAQGQILDIKKIILQ